MFHTSFQPSACAYAVPQFRLVDTCAGQDSMLPLPCRLQGELLLYSRTKHRHRPFPEIYPALLRPGLDVNQNFTEGSGKQKKLEQRNLQPVIKYGGFWSCPLQPTILGCLTEWFPGRRVFYPTSCQPAALLRMADTLITTQAAWTFWFQASESNAPRKKEFPPHLQFKVCLPSCYSQSPSLPLPRVAMSRRVHCY